MTALAIVGDWNGTPADSGRWSPSWLASHAQLRIVSAGPGRHGDIDYAMTDAAAGRARRRPPPGPAGGGRSDHDVYSVALSDPDTRHTLVLASWNMEYGRDPARAAADLHELLTSLQPDVLVLQEGADYHRAIKTAAARSGYVALMSNKPGRWHNIVLTRLDHKVTGARFVRLSPHGWRLAAGGTHAELWATSWLIGGWLRVIDVHMPPSVNWPGGRIRGPVMRVAAYVAAIRKLRRWARRARS